MVDTLTPAFGLTLQTIGGNRNTWGNINNENMEKIEAAISGRADVVLNGGTYTLGDTERVCKVIVVTGTLLSAQTLVFPNLSQQWVVYNGTTGAFPLLLKTASGTIRCSVPRNWFSRVICFGDDQIFRDDYARVGEVFHTAAAAVPAGALELDGSDILRASYPELFEHLGTTWGAGDGSTTFGIPDEKDTGRFRRSRTNVVGYGTYQTNAYKQHNHTASGATSGTALSAGGHAHTGSTSGISANHTHSGTTAGRNAGHTHSELYFTDGGTAAFFADGGFGALVQQPGDVAGTNTGGESADHAHSFTSGNVSSDHAHGFTTNVDSSAHAHTLSATTTVTVNNNGDTETRPEAVVYIACIRV